jgi:hypothetical protein
MLGLRNFIRRLRSVQAGDDQGLRRGEDNLDAMAATGDRGRDPQTGVGAAPSIPPNYIKTYDDGRPRH